MSRPPSDPGAALLEELLRKPPGEVTAWALDQLQALSRPGVDVQSAPLYQLAGALGSAPAEGRQELVAKAIRGYGALPARRKAEAVRAVLQSAPQLQEAPGELRAGRPAPGARAAAAAAAGGQSPLLANLARVAESARLRDVPEQEVRGLRRAVQAEAAKVVRPSEIAEVVGELDPTERDALTEVLIQTGLVPEEHREVLEAAVRPGGYSDKLAGATAWVALARRYAFVAVALPLVELLLSFICGRLVCHVPLAGWLRTDAGLGLLTACASGFGAYLLSPAYAILQKDPIATVQRALAAKSSSPEEHAPGSQPLLAQPPTMVARLDADLRPVLEAAVPGVPYDDFRRAALCLAVALVLFVLGTLWTVVGLVELLAAGGCSVLLVVFSFLFVGLRSVVIAGLLCIVLYIYQELQKHKEREDGTAIPMISDVDPC